MSDRPVLLDVNVPMYAAGRPHPYRDACVKTMSDVAEGRLNAAIDTATIQEILYRYGALRQWSIATALASNLLDVVETVYPVLPFDASLTIDLFERYAPKGVTARDLVHVAVMKSNGLAEIVSTDSHFDLVEGIRRLDPVLLYQSA